MTRFEWDSEKARHVFDDPMPSPSKTALKMVGGVLLLLVAHSVRDEIPDEVIRIISCRRCDGKERKRYEKERQKSHG